MFLVFLLAEKKKIINHPLSKNHNHMLTGIQRRDDSPVIFMGKDFVVHVCLSGIFRGLGDKKKPLKGCFHCMDGLHVY